MKLRAQGEWARVASGRPGRAGAGFETSAGKAVAARARIEGSRLAASPAVCRFCGCAVADG